MEDIEGSKTMKTGSERYYHINDEAARVAHDMNSMREFESEEAAYRAKADAAYTKADAVAESTPEQAEKAYEIADTFACKYAAWLNRSYAIESMCPSMLICGPANFPTRKKQRQNAAREVHMKKLEAINALVEKIDRLGDEDAPIKMADENAIERLRAKADTLQAKQDEMKAANAAARKEGKPVPYPPYSLSNNRQNLTATKKRIEQLEREKDRGTVEYDAIIQGEEVHVLENTEAMRLQLIFDGKPDDEIRQALKSKGFRWSPKAGAWQRQLTNNARFALRSLIEAA